MRVAEREERSPLVKGGEFYLENIPPGVHKAVIRKDDLECSFDMEVPQSRDPVAGLGTVVCEMN